MQVLPGRPRRGRGEGVRPFPRWPRFRSSTARMVTAVVLVMGPAFSVDACQATRPPLRTPTALDNRAGPVDFSRIRRRVRQARAVLVYHAGELVVERYAGTDSSHYWNTHSVTTSVLSALVGIAIERERSRVSRPTLGELLPSYAAGMSPDVAAISLQQLRPRPETSPGFSPAETFWHSPNWVRRF